MIIGKCSCCGGNVQVPDVWYGVNPPVPTCTRCFAIKEDDLPVIKMRQGFIPSDRGFFSALVEKFKDSSGNS